MKKVYASLMALMLTIAATAQTLNIQTGSVIYQFPAAQTGDMSYSNGTTLTVMEKTFTLSDVSKMTVDNSEVSDNTVSVVYDGTSATVLVAGNIAQYVTPTVNGAHVSIVQSDDVAEEITYTLSGSSTDGEFYMSGSYKATVEFNGLTLTNVTPVFSGAAVHIQNGKRIKVKVCTDTNNTLKDAASGSQKGCLYIKGHAEFAQKGTLNIVGNVKHGIKAGEYITLKNATINVTKAVGDGISCNEYFLMESGTVSISGVGDEGIQCELDGTTSTGETADHEGEDSGNIYLEGGTLSVTNTNGEGIESKGALTITGGHITVNAKDDAINAAENLTINGGYVFARSTGNDGIDANGNCYIKGGLVYAIGTTAPEKSIDANTEEGKKLYITGGTIIAVGDLENGASISGGTCKYTSSWTASSWYALYNGGTLVAAFKTPTKSSGGGGPGGGGPGGGGPGGGSQKLIVYTSSTPTLQSGIALSGGTEYFGGMTNIDGTVTGGTNVSLSNYSTGGGWR